jgi:hypothetical protein
MPTRIGHQPPENYFGALAHEKWKQDLPTKSGLYWYTEFEVRDRGEAVWLCKVYRYRQKMYVRFYTGPYRIRMKGRHGAGQIMYAKTLLESVPFLNGNIKWWYPITSAPKPPITNPVFPQEVGGLPRKPGLQSRPKVRVKHVPRKVYGG